MLTRSTDRKIPCVYIHVYRITKKWRPSPYNSLRHADNRGYFSDVLLAEGSGKIWACSCWEKGNFIMINEFKCGQTWKIWPSLLSLWLYNPFNPFLWYKHHYPKTSQEYICCNWKSIISEWSFSEIKKKSI